MLKHVYIVFYEKLQFLANDVVMSIMWYEGGSSSNEMKNVKFLCIISM